MEGISQSTGSNHLRTEDKVGMGTVAKVIEILQAGAHACRTDSCRDGNVLQLPAVGELLLAGDLHNHQHNFRCIQDIAALDENPGRHVLLQELIHGGPLGNEGDDQSIDMLLEAILWQMEYPGRIHFLLANHDLAQVQKVPVTKDGFNLTERFNRHLEIRFGAKAEEVRNALRTFVMSQAIAAISVSGIIMTHSLPGDRDMQTFDPTILRRSLTDEDFVRGGSVHQLIWGRNQSANVLSILSNTWYAEAFICGHQQQDAGFGIIDPNMLIIDSSHVSGSVVLIDLSKEVTMSILKESIQMLMPTGEE